ncbi:MAG: Membrane-associated zinc metalloprotease, partial [candidate division WS6 bacterium GW2011_GWA2_37_6]
FVIFAVYLSILGYKTDLVYIADYPFVGADAEIVQKPIVAKVYNKQLAEQGFSLDEEHYGVIIISLDGEYINDFDEFTAIWNRIENKPVDVEYIFLDNMLLVKSNLVLNSPGYDINIEPSLTDKIIFATVEEGFPADKADIKPRDILLKIDGEPAGYEKRTEFIEFLENNKNRSMVFTVLSEDGEIIDKKVELNGEDKDGVILGSSFSLNKPLQGTQYRLDYSDNKYLAGVAHTINVFGYNPVALYNLMKISIETKDVELASQSVSSIWGVGETLNTLVINRDYKNIINLTGLISVALAFMNILPIPLLDGGQVLFITLEKLRGKPLSAKTQERIANVAFIFLIGFSILIIAKDVWIGFVGDFFRGIL